MEALIVTIIAAILGCAGVISKIAFLLISLGSMVLMFVSASLYFRFGFLKIYYHDLLGWHTPADNRGYHDGCSMHDTCKYCGKDIMMDSQGNWF